MCFCEPQTSQISSNRISKNEVDDYNLIAVKFNADADCSDENDCQNNHDHANNNIKELRFSRKVDPEIFEAFMQTVAQSAGISAIFACISFQRQEGRIIS